MEERSVNVKLSKIDGAMAYLTTEHGHAIAWPRERLPETCAPGDRFFLKLTANEDAESERRKIAIAILNEILKTGGST